MKILSIIIILFVLVSCNGNEINYETYKNAQDYNIPEMDIPTENKSALFIFPHPDDEIVCGGTIAYLKENGWTITLLTLTQGQIEDKANRYKEWENACNVFKFDNVELLYLPNNSWDNVLKDKITFWYDNLDSLENIVYHSIKKYKPSVVFTYDTILGGYGHPEHLISAKIVNQVFQKHKADSVFPVERIYQITLTGKLEELLVGQVETYKKMKMKDPDIKLPFPTIAVDISKYWNTKRNAAYEYKTQFNTLKKFMLLPDVQDTLMHYHSLDREYYYEIKK